MSKRDELMQLELDEFGYISAMVCNALGTKMTTEGAAVCHYYFEQRKLSPVTVGALIAFDAFGRRFLVDDFNWIFEVAHRSLRALEWIAKQRADGSITNTELIELRKRFAATLEINAENSSLVENWLAQSNAKELSEWSSSFPLRGKGGDAILA